MRVRRGVSRKAPSSRTPPVILSAKAHSSASARIAQKDLAPAPKSLVVPSGPSLRSGRQKLLRLHRALVPQAHEIAVGIGEFGAIAPEGFLRAVCEGDAARFPLRIGRVDILDLEPQGAAVGPR